MLTQGKAKNNQPKLSHLESHIPENYILESQIEVQKSKEIEKTVNHMLWCKPSWHLMPAAR